MKKENPKRKISISEATYKKGIRDRERLKKIKVAVKPINQILKNII